MSRKDCQARWKAKLPIEQKMKYRLTAMYNRLKKDLPKQQHQKAARSIINCNIKVGNLLKPTTCSICGYEPPTTYGIHAHHEDPQKPLDVIWVCARCHYKLDPHTRNHRAEKHTQPKQIVSYSEYDTIWDLYHIKKESQRQIGEKYGVSTSAICRILIKMRDEQ